MTITMTVSTKEYEQSATGVAQGFAHSVTYVREGSEQVNRGAWEMNTSQFDIIDATLKLALRQQGSAYRQGAISIEGATLPESLKTFLVDKYGSESPFSSIIFV